MDHQNFYGDHPRGSRAGQLKTVGAWKTGKFQRFIANTSKTVAFTAPNTITDQYETIQEEFNATTFSNLDSSVIQISRSSDFSSLTSQKRCHLRPKCY